jgi:hypothetical protein
MSLGIKRVVVVRKDSVHNDAPQACSMEFETLGVFPKSLWSKQKVRVSRRIKQVGNFMDNFQTPWTIT